MKTIIHRDCLYLCCLFLLFVLPSSSADDFLYSILPFEESDPVLEFEPPPADTNYNENGEDVALKPDFLYSTQQGHRVVLYYLPWCPHCKAYVPTYISLARRLQEMVRERAVSEHAEVVEFYAVSCLPNKQLCKDQHVSGVPGIQIIPAGSITGTPVDPLKLHPFQILRILGLSQDSMDDWNNEEKTFLKGRQKSRKSAGRINKHEMFEDAYRSFHFAMKTEIFMENGPLAEKPKKALADWILLLQNALPLSWKIQPLLKELVDNFETISKDESGLLAILAKHPPKSEEWSHSCSHGEDGSGFTCGLWELFHILAVGVVQFNENAVSANEKSLLKTADVAQTLRDFLEHFFACNVCRTEFLKAFDACSNDRCQRLLDTIGEKRDWMELPLWLWEEHNSVNVRLMRERSKEAATTQGTQEVQWPSRRDCPKCWGEEGSGLDKEVVYEYLLAEYWPGFEHSGAQRRDLFGSALASFGSSSDESILEIPSALLLLPFIGPFCLLVVWFRQRQKRTQSGRHKKLDL